MDELELVRLVRPEVDEPSEAVAVEVRQEVLERVATDRRDQGPWTAAKPTSAGWPRWAVAVPLLAALAAVVVAVAVIVPSNAPSAAAEVLLAAADRAEAPSGAATTTMPVAGAPSDMPGIRYTRWESASLGTFSGEEGTFSAIIHLAREMWVAPDGSGRIAETLEGVEYLSEQDRIGLEEMGEDFAPINESFGPGGLGYADYESLPTDPDELEAVLAEIPHGDWPDNVGLFWSIQDLLRDGGTPPELRAALYRVAAQIDGIELLGEVTDRAGRPGTGVSLTYQGNGLEFRDWIIFDPVTTELLGEESVLLTPSPELRAEPPITVSWFIYHESDTVDQIP
jgi:hypothetical protein